VSDSRVNQATFMPWSIALFASASARWLFPVPEGPATARFSARETHSSAISACWVGAGIEEPASRQESKVLPEGSWARRRWLRRVASSRPLISASRRIRTTSAGSQRCDRAVAKTSGASLRKYGNRIRRSTVSSSGGIGGATGDGGTGVGVGTGTTSAGSITGAVIVNVLSLQ
jgi:hypothetical protein